MQPTDPKLNIVIGAKLSATATNLQSQLDELTRGLEAKVAQISIDDKALQTLNEFAKSFQELSKVLAEQQKTIADVTNAASGIGKAMEQSANQASSAFEKTSKAVDDLIKKREQLDAQTRDIVSTSTTRVTGFGNRETLVQFTDSSKQDQIFNEFDANMNKRINNSLANMRGRIQGLWNELPDSDRIAGIVDKYNNMATPKNANILNNISEVDNLIKKAESDVNKVRQAWIQANADVAKHQEIVRQLDNDFNKLYDHPFVNVDALVQAHDAMSKLNVTSSKTDVNMVKEQFASLAQEANKAQSDAEKTANAVDKAWVQAQRDVEKYQYSLEQLEALWVKVSDQKLTPQGLTSSAYDAMQKLSPASSSQDIARVRDMMNEALQVGKQMQANADAIDKSWVQANKDIETYELNVQKLTRDYENLKTMNGVSELSMDRAGNMLNSLSPASSANEYAKVRDLLSEIAEQQKQVASWTSQVDKDWQQAIHDEEEYDTRIQQIRANMSELSQKHQDLLSPDVASLNPASSVKDYKAVEQAVSSLQKQEKEEQDLVMQNFKDRMAEIKMYYQIEMISPEEAFGKAREVILEHTRLLQQNVQLRKSAISDLYNYEKQVYAEEEKQNNQSNSHPLSRFKFAPTEVMKATIWYGMHDAMQSVASDFVKIQQGAAGLQQVFSGYMQDQQGVIDTTNKFIDIAQRYGVAVSDVLDAAKLWGRQYKDLDTAIALTNSSTLLSVVDNLSVVDANKAVESSMNAMGDSIHNAADAYKYSMQLVDSWSAVSHEASVSAADLTQGFERSAAAANTAKINYNELNALIAAGVRNTGRSGAVIGNMYKSVIANLTSDSPKVKEALKALNIDQSQSIYNQLLQIAEASKNATLEQNKYFEAIAGGKYQYDTLRASLINVKTITDAYNDSVNSNGKAAELAQAQMHTFGAELTRLHDAIQKGVFDSSQGGLTSSLKDMVTWATDLIVGLQQVDPWIIKTIAGIAGLYAAVKMFLNAKNLVKDLGTEMTSLFRAGKDKWNIIRNGIPVTQSGTSQVVKTVTTTTTTQQVASENELNAAVQRTTASLNEEALAQERLNIAKGEGVGADGALVAADVVVTTTEVTETETTAGLTAAFGALDIASGGITLAIGGIITLLTMWGVSAGDAAQKQNELNSELDQMNATTKANLSNADTAAQIKDLIGQYDALSKSTANGMAGSADQIQKYYDVTKQLGQLMPEVVNYVDEEGKYHLNTATAVDAEYHSKLKLYGLDKQGLIDNGSKDFQKQLDTWQQNHDKIKQIEDELNSGQTSMSQYQGDGTYVNVNIPLDPQTVKDLNDQLTKLKANETDALGSMAQNATKAAVAMTELKTKTTIGAESNSFAANLSSVVDWSKIKTGAQWNNAIKSLSASIQEVASAEQNGKLTTNVMQDALDKLGNTVPTLSDKMGELTQSINDVTAAQQNSTVDDWQQKIDQTIKDNKTLTDAEKELSSQHRLSADTLAALIDKYPDIVQATGLETKALEAYIQKQKESSTTDIQTEMQKTQATINGTKDRITAIQAEYSALEAMIEKRLQEAETQPDANGNINQNAMRDAQWLARTKQQYASESSQAQQDLQTAINKMAELQAGYNDIMDAGNNSTSKATNQQNAYKVAIDSVTTAIDAQKAAIQGMNDTSQSYRDGLQKEIDLLNQKANLINKDIQAGGSLSDGTTSYTGGTGVGGSYSGKYSGDINQWASYYGIDPNLVAAVIQQESGFNQGAISSAGAIGLMQLLPSTAKTLGVNPYDASSNIQGGVKYLSEMLHEFNGNVKEALAAYNAGPGAVLRYGGVPPYSQTQSYVSSIMSMYQNGVSGAYGGTFKVGSSGDVVRQIQEKVGATIDGIFGAATQAAVEKWQKAHGLTADGIVGANTLSAMGLDGTGSTGSTGSSGSSKKDSVNQDKQQLIQIQQEIQQLNNQIVESMLKSYDATNTTYGNEISRWQEIAKSYGDGSKQQINAYEAVEDVQKKSIQNIISEMSYINEEMKSTKISAAEKQKLSQTYEKLDSDLIKMRDDLATTNFTIVTDQIKEQDKAVQNLDKQLQNVQRTLQEYPSTSAEYQSAYSQEISLIQQKAQVMIAEQNMINDNIANNANLTDAQKQQLIQQSQALSDSYGQLQDQLVQMKKSAADQIVQAEKDAISKQMKLMDEAHQNAIKQLTDEKDAYNALIDAQIKSLQQTQEKNKYNETLTKDQKDLQKLQNEYNALSMDNSSEGMAKKAELAQQIADQQTKIADEQQQQQDTIIQQNLQDQKQSYDDSIKAEQDAENKKYDIAKQTLQNILDDTEYWNKQITDIMNGNVQDVKQQLTNLLNTVNQSYQTVTNSTENQASQTSTAMQNLATTIQSTMNITGDSIQQNLIDQLNSAMNIMKQLQGMALPSMPNTAQEGSTTNINQTGGSSSGGATGSTGGSTSGTKSGGTTGSTGGATGGSTPVFHNGYDPSKMPVLQEGANNQYVKTAQKLLDEHFGYKLSQDGVFGSGTLSAVKAFQKSHGLTSDGIIGANTWRALDTYNTGGFTGQLPALGGLAILHSKELVLNAEDTQNILDAVKMIREMGVSFGSNDVLIQAIQNMSRLILPEINRAGENGNKTTTINMPITIQSLTGDEKGARSMFETISQQLKRKGVILQ